MSEPSASKKFKFKICMVGSYAVGKTSLVERFVHSIYSDAYHTTIGVKIDKKEISLEGSDVTCVIWDIAGEDEFHTVKTSYLRGMAGYFLVVDGTRPDTLAVAIEIQERIEAEFTQIPFILLLNKADLKDDWELPQETLGELTRKADLCLETSAKTGDRVEEAFLTLATGMVARRS